jgi:hypothetical protein
MSKYMYLSIDKIKGQLVILKSGGKNGKIWVEALVYGATGRGHRVELRSFLIPTKG